MHLGISLSAPPTTGNQIDMHPPQLTLESQLTGSRLRLALHTLSAPFRADPQLSTLDVDGVSILDRVTSPASPELATRPMPGLLQGSGVIVSALAEPLQIGQLYVISYEILDNSGLNNLFVPSNNGAPFSNVSPPQDVGVHHILAVAQNTNTRAIMRLSGTAEFGFMSCRKAEWSVDVPPATTGAERAINTSPGTVSGTDVPLSAVTQPLEVGAAYVISYDITATTETSTIFTSGGSVSCFAPAELPTSPGRHDIVLTAVRDDTTEALRMSGNVTLSALSIRRHGQDADRAVTARIEAGSTDAELTVFMPEPGKIYVAPTGSDLVGTGALQSPFRQATAAMQTVSAGDTVYMRPGVYDPFEIRSSGTQDAPITVTTLPDERHQAVISGALQTTNIHGGVSVIGCDYVHIRNLLVEDMPRDGIHIRGTEGEQHGHHVIANCLTRRTGRSGIFVCGYIPDEVLPLETPRTIDVLVEGCDVSETNIVTQWNQNTLNSLGEPGGVNEAITVVGGVDGIIVRDCDVHDSRQYGIDYKHSVFNGEISGNRVWNIQRYGIYLDTNRRPLENITVFGNFVWQCGAGIVLSREADFDPVADADGTDMLQAFVNITVYNNIIFDIQNSGIFLGRHSGDSPHGEITDVRVSFNTVYNCGLSGSGNEARLVGWADADFSAAGIVSGFEFVGNLLWRDHDIGTTSRMVNEFAAQSGFTVQRNYDGSDPLFVDVTSRPPSLWLREGSPAEGFVDVSDVVSPFEYTANGLLRMAKRAAGAY